MGENYVLGNRDDCNQFTPYLLDPRMFEENTVVMMALGTMHAVALAKESPDAKMPELDSTKFVVAQPMPVSPKPIKKVNGDHIDEVRSQRSQRSQKSNESKKRSRQEFLETHSENAEIGSAVKKLKIEENLPLEPVAEENMENGDSME